MINPKLRGILDHTLKIDKERNCKIALDRISEGIEKVYYELLKTNENLNVLEIKNKFTGKSKKVKELDIYFC